MDLQTWLTGRGAATPETPALITADEVLSWGDLRSRALGAAAALSTRGVNQADLVALALEPGPAWVASLYGAGMLGAVVAPLDRRLTPADRRALASRRGAAVLLEEDPGGSPDRAPIPVGQRPDALASVIHTSGTQAEPKVVELTNANHSASAQAVAAALDARDDDVWLCCLPLWHVGGLEILYRSVMWPTPAPVVLHPDFDPGSVVADIERHRVTLLSVVPTMLAELLEAADGADLSSLRCVLVGGAAAPPDLLAEATERGLPVAPTYGLTEACSMVTVRTPGDPPDRPGSVGRALPGTEVRIEAGEIQVRGPTVMRGYRGNPDANNAALQGGWLRTGDLGELQDGELTVTGRADDVVVTGGENVATAEVEAVLADHPDVAEVAVAGRPDPKWGEALVAYIVPRADGKVDGAALADFCRERLPAFKVPKAFEARSELPRNDAGKVVRARL